MKVFIGGYTDSEHQEGLSTIDLDPATGRMAVAARAKVANALYLALSPDKRYLYSCTGAGLASFRIGSGAALEPVDEVAIDRCVCHVAAMPDGRRVVWADYLAGRAGEVAVADGRFGEIVSHEHHGSGPNLPRQDAAHCHQAMPAPDGQSYCVVDLGLDAIVTYPAGKRFTTSPAGAGPRHLLFHPGGKLAFLVFELGNLVASLAWDGQGGWRILDTAPTLPAGDTGRGPNGDLAAAVRFTPDMQRVVVSNRGENSLVVYDFDVATGKLSLKARTLLPGSWPRDFIFVTETLALATMERSGEVHALRYDAASGEFALAATLGGLFRPVAAVVAP